MARVEGRPVQGNGWRPEHAARRFTRVHKAHALSFSALLAHCWLWATHRLMGPLVTERERGWAMALASAAPCGFPAGTSYLQCGPRDSDLGEPRRYASYEEWFAKSGSGSTMSSLMKHAPSQRSPTDCLTPRLPSKRDASAFDEQERAARGAKAAWTRHSHVSGLSTSSLLSKARLVLSHAFDRALYMQRRSARWLLCTL